MLRAINSVLTQTHQQIEIIVVADRPDHDTLAAVQSLNDSRVRLILNTYTPTAGGARNAGADHATGEWIAFLDDDDEWLPNKLERPDRLSHLVDAGAGNLSQSGSDTERNLRCAPSAL